MGRDNQRPSQEGCSRNFAAAFRRGPNLQGQTSRLLLSSSGTIPNRQGTRARRSIRSGVGTDGISGGGKLLLQAEPAQRLAAVVSAWSQGRSDPRISPDGTA